MNENIQSQNIAGGDVLEGYASVEERSPRTPRYLQKKSAYTGSQYNQPVRIEPFPSVRDEDTGLSARPSKAGKARRGSLRHAVRRIFGRRSKDADNQFSQAGSPSHGYHRSETAALPPQDELSLGRTRDSDFAQRTFSTPVVALPTSDVRRTRSPYAMQFPQSSTLKPLDLGYPFAAPVTEVRRRKTLPTAQSLEYTGAALTPSAGRPADSRYLSSFTGHDSSATEFESPASRYKREKRRSRSAGDLRVDEVSTVESPQQRNEEMRQWRQSFQGSVLRTSGFRARDRSPEGFDEPARNRTPSTTVGSPLDRPKAGATPTIQREMSDRDIGSGSVLSADLSRDLEVRVARLEAGLQSFRGQLAQLSTDRSRSTVLIGGVPTRPRASSDGRTADMLATDLQQDLPPSPYRYGYAGSIQATPPRRAPRVFTRNDPPVETARFDLDNTNLDDPFVSPARVPTASAATDTTVPPQYTFRSLYEMLADERSARRKLETQMKSLQETVANLHQQVSFQSNRESPSSSYYTSRNPMAGSSRLHALLRDTETSRPGTARSPPYDESRGFPPEPEFLVSRFSASESELGGMTEAEETVETPLDAYQTPLEEQGRFPFADNGRSGGRAF